MMTIHYTEGKKKEPDITFHFILKLAPTFINIIKKFDFVIFILSEQPISTV